LSLQRGAAFLGLGDVARVGVGADRNDLERDDAAVGSRVFREKHQRHAAAADLPLNFIRPDIAEDRLAHRPVLPRCDAGVADGAGATNQLCLASAARVAASRPITASCAIP
jgi:hypothetical protein